MLAFPSHIFSLVAYTFVSRRSLAAAAIVLPAMLLANVANADDSVRETQKAAVNQAAMNNVRIAKCTTANVGSNEDAEGETVRERSSASTGWGRYDEHGNQYFLVEDRTPDYVPAEVPAGLPANYLAADPQHGAVVNFVDDRDSNGTRITSRRYADGHVVIETPQSDKNQ